MKNKIAAIDIGTNSFHLIIAYIDESNKIKILESDREVIRLNSVEKSSNIIPQNKIDSAIKILTEFKRIAEIYNAEIKAVATSAVREAENKFDFIKQVYNSTGIDIKIIDGKKEAELIYKGVQRAIELGDKRVLCIDIGGGSTEFIIGKEGVVEFAESVKLGAVRLTKMFFPNYLINEERIKNCEKYINQVLSEVVEKIKKYKIDLAVGSSGTITSVALIKNALLNITVNKNALNRYVFSAHDLENIKIKILNAKTIEERKQIKGMEEKRADVIPAGIILLFSIFKKLELKNLTISGYALREGIIIDETE